MGTSFALCFVLHLIDSTSCLHFQVTSRGQPHVALNFWYEGMPACLRCKVPSGPDGCVCVCVCVCRYYVEHDAVRVHEGVELGLGCHGDDCNRGA